MGGEAECKEERGEQHLPDHLSDTAENLKRRLIDPRPPRCDTGAEKIYFGVLFAISKRK